MTLYKQLRGRGLRQCCECGHPPEFHPEKGPCTICKGEICTCFRPITPIILDHGANLDRHGRPDEDVEWDIDGPPKRTSKGKFKVCPKCFAYLPSNARECE